MNSEAVRDKTHGEILSDSIESLGKEEGLGGSLETKADPVSRRLKGEPWAKDPCGLHCQTPVLCLKAFPGRYTMDKLSGWGL